MEITNFTVKVLRPAKGYKLYRDGVISDEVYLSPTDTEEGWIEITDEEALKNHE